MVELIALLEQWVFWFIIFLPNHEGVIYQIGYQTFFILRCNLTKNGLVINFMQIYAEGCKLLTNVF